MVGFRALPVIRNIEPVIGRWSVSESAFYSLYRCVKQPFTALLRSRKSLVRPLYLVFSGELAKPLRQSLSKGVSTQK